MFDQRVAEAVNVLGRFCGPRDVPALTQAHLQARYGIVQADVMVLFGGSILCGGDVLAQAMRDGAAKRYIIVGGAGHTTESLRQVVHARCPDIPTAGLPEAEVFARYLTQVHHLRPDYLETQSTNCGNNITHLLALMQAEGVECGHIILCQDATMQRRMEAGWRKHADPRTVVVNYAAYQVQAVCKQGRLAYDREVPGMWPMARYVELLMGEIPRLTDDANGYGPCGKGFIAHVDVPEEAHAAFRTLRAAYGRSIRPADPRYATKP